MRGNASRRVVNPLAHGLDKPWLALQKAMNGEALIKAVFRVLEAAVRCDFVNVCLRNVRAERGHVSFRMLDSRGRGFDPEYLENVFFREHPGMPKLMANPGIRFINTREVLASGDFLYGTPFYREVMQVVGFRHAVGMFFWDHPPRTPEAIFSLLRVEGQPDFDDAEVTLLDRIYPHVAAALERVSTVEKERALSKVLHASTRHSARAVCVLDWDLHTADATFAAQQRCARWHSESGSARKLKLTGFHLPPSVRGACEELKARWQASLGRRAEKGFDEQRVVPHPSLAGWQATVALRVSNTAPFDRPTFLVEFEGGDLPLPATRRKGAKPGRPELKTTLTEREREISLLVCEGKSNQEIARQTGLAIGSVKNSVHAIFKKLGVPSRTALSALLHSARAPGSHRTKQAKRLPYNPAG